MFFVVMAIVKYHKDLCFRCSVPNRPVFMWRILKRMLVFARLIILHGI